MTSTSCRSNCGVGAPLGRCTWLEGRGRRGGRRHTENDTREEYGLCVSQKKTCPDHHCDELERMVDMLCPCDCKCEYSNHISLLCENIIFSEKCLFTGNIELFG